jgi:hypothetical protein
LRSPLRERDATANLAAHSSGGGPATWRRIMKTLIAVLTLATLFVAPAAPSYASAARNPRHDSDRGKQNYDPIYKGYPLSRWYWYG